MTEHTLTVLPGLPGAATVSGKCSCQARWNGATDMEVVNAFHRHLADLGHETPEETERLDDALEVMTREDRAEAETAIARGEYGTPMDEVFAELEAEEESKHRQSWTNQQVITVIGWMADHSIDNFIGDPDVMDEAARDLLDALWDAKLLAGS